MTQTNDTNVQHNGGAATVDSHPHHNHSPQDSVERAFELLSEAQSLESESDFWKAAEVYVQAQQLLQALSEQATRTANQIISSNNDDHRNSDCFQEQQQIAKLYSDKAQEYLSHSRKCLIEAMQKEKTNDEEAPAARSNVASTASIATALTGVQCSLIDDDQAKARNQTFALLFSRLIVEDAEMMMKNVSTEKDTVEEGSSNIVEQQWSIEERLQELNKSLPSGFKTDEERMEEINRGLNRLGLSLYTQKQPFARLQKQLTLPKNEEEQIDDVIAQAYDEATFENQTASGLLQGVGSVQKEQGNEDDDDGLSQDSDSDATDPGDEHLQVDQLAIKRIRKRLIKAQVKLAELVPLLDQVNFPKDEEYNKDLNVGILDIDSSSEESKSNAAFPPPLAKRKLEAAQRDLRKAMQEWNDALLVGTMSLKCSTSTMRSIGESYRCVHFLFCHFVVVCISK